MTTHELLVRPEGRLAYHLVGPTGPEAGAAPLVVCVSGMGDLRQSYRLLVPLLVARGFRVATLDLRGHGDSDATFDRYDDVALGSDILALVEHLGGPGLVVGNSMGAGAAVWAAAERPDLVSGLALLGPFVRDGESGWLATLMFRLALVKPWGPSAFLGFYPKWLPGTKPEGYDEHVLRLRDNLRRPGHWKAFVRTTRTSHAPAEARIGDVTAPTVVVMGEADVDWKDPAAEARWVGDRLHAEVVLLPGVGHYPQAQAPEQTAAAILRLTDGAARA